MRWIVAFLLLPLAGAQTPAPSDRPFVKLLAVYGPGKLDDASEEQVRHIGRTFGWINSHGGSWLRTSYPKWEYMAGKSGGDVGKRLRAVNPNIILTNYRNGAYTNQGGVHEAGEQERALPLAIAVHDTGARLAEPVTASAASIVLRPPSEIPKGKPAIYPFKASTTPERYTLDKRRYVAWLRLDDEILRIDKAEAREGRIVLSVARGYWNTKSAAHGPATTVLAPVYCGSIRPDGREYYLSGLPDGNSAQPALRYVLMQQRPEFWEYLAAKSKEAFDEGLNGPWYDCTVSSWINHSNAWGVRLAGPWDVDLKRPLDRETFREYHQRKLDDMFRRFPKGQFFVNWFFPKFYFGEGHEKLMFSGANGHRPISGGAIEMYANENFMDWKELMAMQIDMIKNRYTVAAWIKRADTGSDENMPHDYQLFAYGTHLLVYEPDAPQYWGGAWKVLFTPPPFVYWELGRAKEKFDRIEQAELAGAPGVYRRLYEKGIVLVNPDLKKTLAAKLEREYYETESGRRVSSVELPPRSARLLLQ